MEDMSYNTIPTIPTIPCYVVDMKRFRVGHRPKLAFIQKGSVYENYEEDEEYVVWGDMEKVVLLRSKEQDGITCTQEDSVYCGFDSVTGIYYIPDDCGGCACMRVLKAVKDKYDNSSDDPDKTTTYHQAKELLYEHMHDYKTLGKNVEKGFRLALVYIQKKCDPEHEGVKELIYKSYVNDSKALPRTKALPKPRSRSPRRPFNAKKIYEILHSGKSPYANVRGGRSRKRSPTRSTKYRSKSTPRKAESNPRLSKTTGSIRGIEPRKNNLSGSVRRRMKQRIPFEQEPLSPLSSPPPPPPDWDSD